MIEVISTPKEESFKNAERKALRVFLKALDILGGPRKLFEYRNLTWLPSLMEAAYVIVWQRDLQKSTSEIAQDLGLSTNTVRAILSAKEEEIQKMIDRFLKGEEPEEGEEVRSHRAGGLAKLAYQAIEEGKENIDFLADVFSNYSHLLCHTWPVEVLEKIKGVDFPVDREYLTEKLKEIDFQGKQIKDFKTKLSAEIKSPSQLLKEIAESLQLKI